MEGECPLCPGTLQAAKIALKVAGVDIGNFDGEWCDKCGEEFIPEESAEEAHKIVVQKGLFGKNKLKEMGPCKLPLKHSH